MKVKALIHADTRLGVPLCFVLTMLRKLFGRRWSEPPRSIGSILFVKLAEQGSTVLAYPALRRAVEMVGRERVFFVCLDDNRFVVDALGVIPKRNVLTIPSRSVASMLRGTLVALAAIRRMRPDAAVDLEFFARGSAVLAFLSGARRRVGFHGFFRDAPYRGDLMTHRVLYNPHLHTSEAFLSLVEALGRDPTTLPTFPSRPHVPMDDVPAFTPSPEEVGRVQAMLRRETGGVPPLVLLNANASDLLPLRRWPGHRYIEVASRVLQRYPDVVVGFTGAPDEAEAIGALVRGVGDPRCVLLAGKTTLRELLTLYTVANVLVTNDSGPAHFATLTPIRVVTLFGPETPTLFAARTPRNTVLWARLACSPCVSAYNNRQTSCRDNACMQAISVDAVCAEVWRAYEASSLPAAAPLTKLAAIP
jgi:ADP-heptose:LPS heptosyltransferase